MMGSMIISVVWLALADRAVLSLHTAHHEILLRNVSFVLTVCLLLRCIAFGDLFRPTLLPNHFATNRTRHIHTGVGVARDKLASVQCVYGKDLLVHPPVTAITASCWNTKYRVTSIIENTVHLGLNSRRATA